MPASVTALRSKDSTLLSEIDVSDEQQALLEAEAASLTVLESCSMASASFVSFMRKTGYSIVHPRSRQLLARARQAMDCAFDLSTTLSEGHRIAQGMIDAKQDATIVMSGGIFKDDPNAESQEYL